MHFAEVIEVEDEPEVKNQRDSLSPTSFEVGSIMSSNMIFLLVLADLIEYRYKLLQFFHRCNLY